MGKTVAESRSEIPNWFHVGVIASPGYDPTGFERHVARTLAALLSRKGQTHKIGIYGVLGEPVSQAAGESWVVSNYAVDQFGGRQAWLRVWTMIAATCEALVVFGPADPTMELVLGMCRQMGCTVRRVDGQTDVARTPAPADRPRGRG